MPTEKKTAKKGKFAAILSKNRYPLYAFAIACAIMVFVYVAYKFIPIGEMSILRMDLYHQYGPLFAEFYDRITHFSSLFYSWVSGLGGTFMGNYLNYLSNPVNDVIMLIFGHDNMPEAIAVMVLANAALASATMTYFINKHFDRYDLSTTAFGLLYAFCGFFVAYYWNIMWLAGMVLFPLVILGIEKIIDGKPAWLYIGALTGAMLTSYYMAYMICIFSVVWFVIYYFMGNSLGTDIVKYDLQLTRREYNSLSSADKHKLTRRNLVNNKFIVSGLKFAGASALSFLLSCVALIPLYYILKGSSATGNSFPSTYTSYFSVFDFLANHLAGVTPTIRSSGTDVLPNIYSGMLPLVLVPLFLFSGKTTIREKIGHVALLALFYFSFNVNYLNFVWHGFHFPNDLPYRFSFAYTFFLLYMAYKAFVNLDSISSKAIMGVGTAIIAFTIFVQKIGSKNVLADTSDLKSAKDSVIWATIAFVVIYCVVLAFIKNPKYYRASMCALLLCAVITEVIVVDTGNYEFTQEKKNFVVDTEDFNEMKSNIDVKEAEENPVGFYRMELSNLRARMDPSWYGYNGVSIFSSMADEGVSKMMKKLGFFGNNVNSYTYFPQTPVFNALFSIKYVFDKNTDNRIVNSPYYTYVRENTRYKAWENEYLLPLAYCANDDVLNWVTSDSNPFVGQGELFKAVTGVSGLYRTLYGKVKSVDNMNPVTDENIAAQRFSCSKVTTGKLGSVTVEVTAETDGETFLYVYSMNSDGCIVSGPAISVTMNLDNPYLLDCGYLKAGESFTAELQVPNNKDSAEIEFYAATLNDDKFKEGYQAILDAGVLEYTSFEDTRFAGTITAAKDCTLFTSIPYDEGWTVTIDGVAVDKNEYCRVNNALLALPVTQGTHEVVFKYTPRGFAIGLIVSLASLLFLILFVMMKRRKALFFSEQFIDKITLRKFVPEVRIDEEYGDLTDEDIDRILERKAEQPDAGDPEEGAFDEITSESADEAADEAANDPAEDFSEAPTVISSEAPTVILSDEPTQTAPEEDEEE
ncbi:MAG: YfhO family protein [Clostridia bacterium]|nr:YfhO family protein [Clostridia bacterium]